MSTPSALAEKPAPRPAQKGRWLQPVVLLVMLLVWAVVGVTGAAAFLVAYVVALILVNFGLSWFGLNRAVETWSTRRRLLLYACVAAAPLAVLARVAVNSEPMRTFSEMEERARDKYYLEQLPCFFPAFVSTDQPQRFFIHSPGSRQVDVQFQSDSAALQTEDLGNGLFLLDFDPRKHELKGDDGATMATTIIADGAPHSRKIRLVHPRPHPRWFASSPSAGLAATVSEETDELIVVHRNGTSRRVPVDDGPTDCGLIQNGERAVVCHRYQPTLCVVDTSDGHVIERKDLTRGQVRLAVAPDESRIAVAIDGAKRGIQFLSLPDLRATEFISLSFSPDWIVFGRDASELVVTDRLGRNIHRLRHMTGASDSHPQTEKAENAGAGPASADAASGWAIADPPIALARPVVTLCRAPSGKEVIVSATAAELGHVPITANHFVEDALHHINLESWEVVQTYTTHRGGMNQDEPGTTVHGASPMGITPFGNSLLVAFAGSGDVGFSSNDNGASLQFRFLDDGPLGTPHGVADLGDDCWCVSSPADATIGVFNSEDEMCALVRLAPDEDTLADSNRKTLERVHGEQTFYETTRAGLSCQSCHLHADSDEGLHSIGEVALVGVLTVRGVAGTSPYLRAGEYQKLGELHDVVEEVYRGYQNEVDWDRPAALDAYLSSLPPRYNWRILEPHNVEQLRAGMSAFVKAECTTCHAPPAMTNLGQHPTNVVFPEYGKFIDENYGIRNFLDVPTLRSIATTPPYLHDGRADSLEAIFRKQNPSSRHGNTAALSEEEFQSLIAFLEQL